MVHCPRDYTYPAASMCVCSFFYMLSLQGSAGQPGPDGERGPNVSLKHTNEM